MTKEEKEVAKQLAAHPNFRPMVCMKFLARASDYPLICTSWAKDTHTGECTVSQEGEYYTLGEGCCPDISHPATKGCLVALARELWGVRGQTTEWCDGDDQEDPEMWAWQRCDNRMFLAAPTEGIALARAIMEAPKR